MLRADIDTSIFNHDAEKALYAQLSAISDDAIALAAKREYTAALSQLASLKEPVDAFFDDVMVMDDDMAVRTNRINLLRQLNQLFLQIADISELQS